MKNRISNRIPKNNPRRRAVAPLAAGLAMAAWGGVAANAAQPHVGEDGQTYRFDTVQARSPGLTDKIEPAALAAAKVSANVNLAVYVARPAPHANATDPVEAIKARHRPQIEALSEQMRAIWRRYAPANSLSEREERAHIQSAAAVLSRVDQDTLVQLQREHDDVRTAMHKEVGAALHSAGLDQRREVSSFVTSLGGTVHAEVGLTNALAITLPTVAIQSLAGHPLVAGISHDPDTQFELDTSVPSAGYDDWHASPDGPFLGGAYDFGIIDTGVQEDHPGFSNVDAFYSNFVGTDTDSHGTHCTGIVANNSTNYVYGGPYTGTAPDLDALIWGAASNTQATTMARMDDLMTDFAQSPEVVNHSLGYNSTGGAPSGPVSISDYVNNDSFYDAYVRNYDVQVTKSAGNSGWGASATLTFPANAHNIMVVANMNDQNTQGRSDDVRSGSSSVGPTASGRRKPDISAPGSSIISTNAFWNSGVGSEPNSGCAGNGTDMCTKSGTSMAAPHIAGAILLQHDGGNLDAQAQKAVLLNTADWWTSEDTSSTADDGQIFSQTCAGGFDPCITPWDRSYGWGYVDMTEALFNRGDYFVDSVVPRNDTPAEDDYELYRGYMFTDEKATMVWEKRADTYVAGGTAGGQRALSDLNIRLYEDATGRLMDGDFVGNDNVHQVAADASGDAVIKVYAWSNAFDGSATETFWLATEENFQRASPPSFSAIPLIPVVGPFQTFELPSQISNTGGLPAHDVSVSLADIAGVSGDGSSQNIGTIEDGANERADFTVTTTGLAEGIYTIGVSVSSNSYDETYTGSFPTGTQFIVETTPPTSSCSGTPTYTNANSVPVPWTASDGFSGSGVDTSTLYAVIPGGAAFVSTGLTQSGAAGSFNYGLPAGDGAYRFAVAATDQGGNFEGVPTSTECTTTRDTVNPDAIASTPAEVAAGPIAISWTWNDQVPSSGQDAVELWYYQQPAGPWTYTGLSSNAPNGALNWAPPGPGVYDFVAVGTDRAGNVEALPPGNNGDSTTIYATTDSDGDGVTDDVDNCLEVQNADQRDTDLDDIGNACDADINGDCTVNFGDLAALKAVFFPAPYDPHADFDGDGFVNFGDLAFMKSTFFNGANPGPGPGAPGNACE